MNKIGVCMNLNLDFYCTSAPNISHRPSWLLPMVLEGTILVEVYCKVLLLCLHTTWTAPDQLQCPDTNSPPGLWRKKSTPSRSVRKMCWRSRGSGGGSPVYRAQSLWVWFPVQCTVRLCSLVTSFIVPGGRSQIWAEKKFRKSSNLHAEIIHFCLFHLVPIFVRLIFLLWKPPSIEKKFRFAQIFGSSYSSFLKWSEKNTWHVESDVPQQKGSLCSQALKIYILMAQIIFCFS